MSEFSELIKNFGKTRDYVRDFFIYGFKVRKDFGQKSERTFDDVHRRVRSWLRDYVRHETSERGQQVSITVDSGHITENPLYQAFYAKSFTPNDIRLHFMLMDLLSDREQHTIHELTENLYKNYEAIYDEQAVRIKLREYVKEGLVISEKSKKAVCFRLSADETEAFLEAYDGLTDAVRFFSGMQPFGVIGDSILKSAGLQNDAFLFKHNYIVHTLEDEMLLVILEAMTEKCCLQFSVSSSRSALTGVLSERKMHCVPLQIFTSVQTGRRYLIGYTPEYQRYNAFRLDFIRDVKRTEQYPEYDMQLQKLQEMLPKLFSVSFGHPKKSDTTEPLRILLRIREDKEAYVMERVRREMRSGTFEKTDTDTFLLTLDIFDPQEALPWLRTFTGRILSIEGGSASVREQFYQDIVQMQKLYEEETNVDIQ